MGLEEYYKISTSAEEFGSSYLGYLTSLMNDINIATIGEIVQEIEDAQDRGSYIYFIGNGGSASIASHYANDLYIGVRPQKKPYLKVLSLTDNVASISAIANDEGYDNIFSMQLDGIVNKDDLVIAFSVSGNSMNVIRGIHTAQDKGAKTIGITGFDGGKLRSIADISLHIPTEKGEYGPVEDIFSIIGHLTYSFLKAKNNS